jgi:hypothetical protein
MLDEFGMSWSDILDFCFLPFGISYVGRAFSRRATAERSPIKATKDNSRQSQLMCVAHNGQKVKPFSAFD